MGPIERAARALCVAEWNACNGLEKLFFATAQEAADAMWQSFIPSARAVLRAIREPSMRMTLAFHRELPEPCGKTAEEVWQAMIDAVLGEAKPHPCSS